MRKSPGNVEVRIELFSAPGASIHLEHRLRGLLAASLFARDLLERYSTSVDLRGALSESSRLLSTGFHAAVASRHSPENRVRFVLSRAGFVLFILAIADLSAVELLE